MKQAPFFARSLTLVPRFLLLNRTETLATQAIQSNPAWTPAKYGHLSLLRTVRFVPGERARKSLHFLRIRPA